MTEGWRNRIVGSGEEPPDQLLANPRNWRVHGGPQRDALRGSLAEVGWVQQIMVNRRTGFVVDGHARVEEALSAHEPTVPVLYVDLSDEEERLILATLDPIGAMAGRNEERLGELLAELTVKSPGLQALLDSLGTPELAENIYTAAVNVPQYQITGEDPPPSDLYDAAKAMELAAAIEAADLPTELRAFLLAAAQRHVVFNYALIAESYAHASPEVQRLYEDSALIIIDLDDAIRNGFVRFTKELAELEDDDG